MDEDETKLEKNPNELLGELREEFESGDVDDAIERAQELGIGLDEISD